MSYHRIKEAITANIVRYHHISGEENPADVSTKCLLDSKWWPFLEECGSENLHLYDVVKMMSVELSVLCSCTFCEEYEVREMILEKILESKIAN